MKKLILPVFVITFCPVLIFGQNNFEFGVKAGGNLSNIKSDNPFKKSWADSKFGFNVGGITNYNFTEDIALHSGVELTKKGFKYNYDNWFIDNIGYKDIDCVANLTYIQIPVSFAYKIYFNFFKLVPEIGMYLSYGIKGNYKYNPDNINGEKTYIVFHKNDEYYFNKYTKRQDIGINAAAGVEFNRCVLKFGYEYGFTNIQRNSNISLSVGYIFLTK